MPSVRAVWLARRSVRCRRNVGRWFLAHPRCGQCGLAVQRAEFKGTIPCSSFQCPQCGRCGSRFGSTFCRQSSGRGHSMPSVQRAVAPLARSEIALNRVHDHAFQCPRCGRCRARIAPTASLRADDEGNGFNALGASERCSSRCPTSSGAGRRSCWYAQVRVAAPCARLFWRPGKPGHGFQCPRLRTVRLANGSFRLLCRKHGRVSMHLGCGWCGSRESAARSGTDSHWRVSMPSVRAVAKPRAT